MNRRVQGINKTNWMVNIFMTISHQISYCYIVRTPHMSVIIIVPGNTFSEIILVMVSALRFCTGRMKHFREPRSIPPIYHCPFLTRLFNVNYQILDQVFAVISCSVWDGFAPASSFSNNIPLWNRLFKLVGYQI